jgi:mevalonate kinase
MLLGEHAVLHGRRALVCAINKRMTVSLSQINKPILRIVSDLGTYETPLGELTDHPDFRFVLDAVRQYPLKQGIELKIESEFSSDIGFGSSAAVTVATHAAFMRGQSLNIDENGKVKNQGLTPHEGLTPQELFKRSLATIHRVQGRGSGADVAASVFGGVVAYRAEPLEIIQLKESFPLTAVYSGSKMKTAAVIRYLEERRALNPDYFERIFDRMDASVGEVIADFPTLGRNLILNQKLMEEMGLCNDALAEIIQNFQTLDSSEARKASPPWWRGNDQREWQTPAKISGSGLGDCVIGLGTFSSSAKATVDKPTIGPERSERGSANEEQRPQGVANFPTYPLEVSPEGCV